MRALLFALCAAFAFACSPELAPEGTQAAGLAPNPVVVSVEVSLPNGERICLVKKITVIDSAGDEYPPPFDACLDYAVILPPGRTLGGVRALPTSVAYALAVDAN